MVSKKPDPLKPSPGLLSKLGSMIVHADEFFGFGGHSYDKEAFTLLMHDDEVKEWLASMRAIAMAPEKRL